MSHHGTLKDTQTLDIRAESPDPALYDFWVLYLEKAPSIADRRDPTFVVAKAKGIAEGDIQTLWSRAWKQEFWVFVGVCQASNPQGCRSSAPLRIDMDPRLYPERHPCSWYAARDGIPDVLSLHDSYYLDMTDAAVVHTLDKRFGHACSR